MEATAQSIEDTLIDSLSFKLKPGASYVTNRRMVTFFPEGGNQYSPSGVSVMRLKLTGSDWLDPSSVVFSYTLKNNDTAKPLYPLSGPHCFFRRMRVLCGGVVLEDFEYNRVHEMMSLLQNKSARENDYVMGFGSRVPDVGFEVGASSANWNRIPAGRDKTVYFRLMSGILNQDKYLPIRYAPLTIELTLVGNATDPVAIAGTGLTSASNSWELNNVQVKADLVTLDNALDNEYAQHLLSGKSLPINFNTFVSQQQVLSGQSPYVNIARSMTRLKTIFTSFDCTDALKATYNITARDWNYFYHPVGRAYNSHSVANDYNPSDELELQLQIGSKLIPEMPIRSIQEHYYQLQKALGILNTPFYSIDIDEGQYCKSRFVSALDAEKVLGAGFTGLNTKAGDLLTIKVNNLSNDSTVYPSKIHVVLQADMILNIRDTGVEVFD